MRRGIFSLLLTAALFLMAVCPLYLVAQSSSSSSQTAVSDPQAMIYANQALVALEGTHQVSDVTLTGTAIRMAGSDVESGNISLKALGTGDSLLDFSSPSGTRSEVRNLSNGPGGFWVGLDGVSHAMAAHNCMTDAVWFFPALSILSQLSNPNLIANYIGRESKNGEAVYHLRFSRKSPTDTAGVFQQLTFEDFYLDASTFVPVAILFQAHPDDNASQDLSVEVDLSDYRPTNGILVPFRVTKLINGSTFLDISIQAVNLNTGLSESAFGVE